MKILIVDDEPMQCDLLKGFLEKQGHTVATANRGDMAVRLFSERPFQLVLMDHRMPDMNGDVVLEHLKATNPLVRSIMITAYGTVDTAVRVMKLGADDFMEKPVDLVRLNEKIEMIEQSLTIAQDAEDVTDTLEKIDLPIKIIGNSPAMQEVLSLTQRIAATPWNVLIKGETGTGKELFARLIHLLSPRCDQPFIDINCAAIPENLFESELFGHEKGAFTGAVATRHGRFELAAEGTLFLDEIGEMPYNLQAKLLRALQEKKIFRVGSEKEMAVNVRVVAATNRNLKDMVINGGFREDLLYRLNVLDIEVPPLRARKVDIPSLTDWFLEKYSPHPIHLDADAMATLVRYAFPGNVRELEHIIQRTVALSRSGVIKERDLPAEVRFYQAIESGTLNSRLEALEREMLITALETCDYIQTRAAESLGISERVLRYKMKKHNLGNMLS